MTEEEFSRFRRVISNFSDDMSHMSNELRFFPCRTRDLELELRTVPRDPRFCVRRNSLTYEVGGEQGFFQNDLQVRRRLNDGAYELPIRDGHVHDGFSGVIHPRRPEDHGAYDLQQRQPGGPRCSPTGHEGIKLRH